MTRHWLSAERIRLYAAAILAVYLAAAATLLLRLHGGVDAHGYPLGSDFIAYWGASHAALGGDAPGAYDPPLLLAAERACRGWLHRRALQSQDNMAEDAQLAEHRGAVQALWAAIMLGEAT